MNRIRTNIINIINQIDDIKILNFIFLYLDKIKKQL